MFHEFLHTVGQLDIKVGNYLGVPDQRPPSANGYRSSRYWEILNIVGRETRDTRVMYECMVNQVWLHTDEHLAVMQHLYTTSVKSPQSPDVVAAPKVASGPRMRLHGHFNLNGNQAVLDPAFADIGEPCNPYPSTPQSGDMFYLELLGAGQEQLGIYYIPVVAPALQFTPRAGQTTPVEDMPLDSRFSALFDFSVPAVAGLTAVRMGYAGLGSSPVLWKTIGLSASTPVLQWVNQPTGTLSQPTTIEWSSTDADGAGVVLAHEFYVSADGGSTWRQVANRIPSHVAGEQQIYSYRFDPASWPAGNQYRFKVLASDGLRTGELATSANAAVSGYDPNPKAELLIAKWEASRPESGFFTVLVPLRNGGRGTLEVWPDLATLPDWLSQTDLEPAKLSPMSDGLLLLSGKQNAMGTFETTITLNTNDPATPTLMLPLKLIQQTPALAPQIARIELFPNYPDSHAWQPSEMVRLTLWDNDCRPAMEAFVTINQQGPAKTALVTDLPMESGSLPGEYRIDWTIPADATDGRYGFEFTLRDPAASLDSKDDTHVLTVKRFVAPEVEGEGESDHVMVPNVEGQTQTAATATLSGENLVVGAVTQQCSDTMAAGNVISQGVVPDQSVPTGSALALTVSTGPCNATVPYLLGMTQTSAAAALTDANLVIGEVTEQCSNTMEANNILSQNPVAGTLIPVGSSVSFSVSFGSCFVSVPNLVLVGMTQALATTTLAEKHLGVGAITLECSETVSAGCVSGQSPEMFRYVATGSTVALTISTGPCGTEGEGEGESPSMVAQALNDNFSAADTDQSGGLSLAEAKALVSSIDTDAFNTLDANHDGQLTKAELQQYLNPSEGEGQAEGEPVPTVAQTLNDNFTATDTDQSGGLSLAEAQAHVPGLDASTFNTLDINQDGQLTLAELQQYLGTTPTGCACASQKGNFDLKRRLDDLLLLGVSLMVIVLMSRRVG